VVFRQPVAVIAAFSASERDPESVRRLFGEEPSGIGARSSTENGIDLSVIKAHFVTASSSD
jgi:hypothetical protein